MTNEIERVMRLFPAASAVMERSLVSHGLDDTLGQPEDKRSSAPGYDLAMPTAPIIGMDMQKNLRRIERSGDADPLLMIALPDGTEPWVWQQKDLHTLISTAKIYLESYRNNPLSLYTRGNAGSANLNLGALLLGIGEAAAAVTPIIEAVQVWWPQPGFPEAYALELAASGYNMCLTARLRGMEDEIPPMLDQATSFLAQVATKDEQFELVASALASLTD